MNERKPRILFVIGSLREGGAEGQLVHLMRGLRDRGWDVHLMLLRYEGMRLQEVLDEGFEVFDAKVPRFRPRWSLLPWLNLVRSLRRSRSYIQTTKPDIVHSLLLWAHVWAALIRDNESIFLTARRQIDSEVKHNPFLRLVRRWAESASDLIVCNSKAVAKAVGRRKRKPVVIYNGVDTNRIDRVPAADLRNEFPGLGDAERILITVANILPHKGHLHLVQAWESVTRDFPATNLFFVGEDTPRDPELSEQVERLRQKHPDLFAGSRDDKEVPALLKGADMAVHPSLDEGFSNAILEYMACGLPIVATDVGGVREAIQHGKHGLIVPPGDSESLAKAIYTLLSDRQKAQEMGAAARQQVRKRFSIERMVDRYDQLYRVLCKKK